MNFINNKYIHVLYAHLTVVIIVLKFNSSNYNADHAKNNMISQIKQIDVNIALVVFNVPMFSHSQKILQPSKFYINKGITL